MNANLQKKTNQKKRFVSFLPSCNWLLSKKLFNDLNHMDDKMLRNEDWDFVYNNPHRFLMPHQEFLDLLFLEINLPTFRDNNWSLYCHLFYPRVSFGIHGFSALLPDRPCKPPSATSMLGDAECLDLCHVRMLCQRLHPDCQIVG